MTAFAMNSQRRHRVTGRPKRRACVVFSALFAGLLGSQIQCVSIDGGASELTWSVRTFAGDPVDACSDSQISHIRLCWNAADSGVRGCRPGQFRDFDCEDQTGVTRFEIPPGDTRLYVEPICEDGLAAAPGTYQTPADIIRNVREGEVVTLDSLLIVVTDPKRCDTECTCQR